MVLVDNQKENLEVLELDGAELSDDSMEKISTCPRLKKFGVSFAELLTGKSLRFLRVNNSSNFLKICVTNCILIDMYLVKYFLAVCGRPHSEGCGRVMFSQVSVSPQSCHWSCLGEGVPQSCHWSCLGGGEASPATGPAMGTCYPSQDTGMPQDRDTPHHPLPG